ADPAERESRCREIFAIQSAGLAERVARTGAKRMVLGVSGGLDSTLAMLVCAKAADRLGLPRASVLAVTMPGFGTTRRTRGNAEKLAALLGAELRTVPIGPAVKRHFADIGHDPAVTDVTYENAQARERTQILMDLANQEGGLVVGTGDLSEIALGWCTYNGDQMAMYNVNGGVPKTLVRFLVESEADASPRALAAVLRDVAATPVSPELVPGGAESQKTEGVLGRYDLHDFFLYHFLKYGETAENLKALALHAFGAETSPEEVGSALAVFLRRFVTQQFKRNPAPDGPKVGTIALSPRGDWRAPSDASPAAFMP
ncbi:MAG: NAD(+) synthase, partial [Kiritimatiellae bacterium]|nr:NAD(+) synthase [Kiritimatiellia bacterium]